MGTLRIEAPAKVNYRLDVLRKRPDGYHDLRMVMQRINLCDSIELRVSRGGGIRVCCGKPGVPDGPGNIAWRAADLLLKETGGNAGVEIAITKRIPVAAGLGGGSSDCAAVLTGLNRLLGLELSRQRLMELGVKLGADVPFFIFEKPALAEGIGELLSPVDLPPVWLVLVNPGIHVSTGWVYGNLQLTSRFPENIMPRFGSIDDICGMLHNDLEAVTVSRFPVISEIKERLIALGSSGSLMSGSGPTVFGIFKEKALAEKAAGEMARTEGWFSAAVETI